MVKFQFFKDKHLTLDQGIGAFFYLLYEYSFGELASSDHLIIRATIHRILVLIQPSVDSRIREGYNSYKTFYFCFSRTQKIYLRTKGPERQASTNFPTKVQKPTDGLRSFLTPSCKMSNWNWSLTWKCQNVARVAGSDVGQISTSSASSLVGWICPGVPKWWHPEMKRNKM